MSLPACPELQTSAALKGCDTDDWKRISQLSWLALENTPSVARWKLRSFVNSSQSELQGCTIGRLVATLLQFMWLPVSRLSLRVQEQGTTFFDRLPSSPLPMWPVYRLMQELQTRMWKGVPISRLQCHCDLRSAIGMSLLCKELHVGMLHGTASHSASVLLDMNHSQVCPLATAAALWASAAAQHSGSMCLSERVLRLLHRGRALVKHWHQTWGSIHELFSTQWPLWGFMAQLEKDLRLPATGKRNRLVGCPHGNRNLLTIGLESVRVEAVVVFGRPDRMRILHRYLWRNLRINGGLLDHVMFVVLRATPDAQAFLHQLVAKYAPHYSIPPAEGKRLDKIYSVCKKPGTIYIKIDDDIVYISDATIPSLIREKHRLRCSLVSANVINHAILSSVHDEFGAIRNFLPPSALNLKRRSNFTSGQSDKPETHWRRADGEQPIKQIERLPQSDCVWASWECAAWMHESFLSRLEDGTSCAYDFGWYGFHTEGFETYSESKKRFLPLRTSRWSINFFAFTRESLEVADWAGLAADDEAEMSYKVPSRIGIQACAVGRAIVSHFSYSKQDSVLVAQSDILHRYDVLSDAITREQRAI